jgi:hypothetical protein
MRCASNLFGCSGLTAKGRRNRFTAIHQLPRHQALGFGGLSELSGKGVCVKYLVVCLVAFCALAVLAPPVRADQPAVNDFAGQIMSNNKTGLVGIGTREPAATLDVYKGEIKIGSTGATCTKALDGALRAKNSQLQFCDGASWRNVSLDKGQ